MKRTSYFSYITKFAPWWPAMLEAKLRAMTENLKKALGARVRAHRVEMKLTQEALASLIGLTSESVSNIERGIHMPTIETLSSISSALERPLSELVADLDASSTRGGSRITLEAEAIAIVRGLPDHDLRVAIEQMRALSRPR